MSETHKQGQKHKQHEQNNGLHEHHQQKKDRLEVNSILVYRFLLCALQSWPIRCAPLIRCAPSIHNLIPKFPCIQQKLLIDVDTRLSLYQRNFYMLDICNKVATKLSKQM